MGKSKSRIFRKGINDQLPTMSRQNALEQSVVCLDKRDIPEAKRLITIFGIAAEELLEAGADYESVVAIKSVFEGV